MKASARCEQRQGVVVQMRRLLTANYSKRALPPARRQNFTQIEGLCGPHIFDLGFGERLV